MRSRSTLSKPARSLDRFPNTLSSTIVAVKAPSVRGRAELIRDVVDAYRRLHGSVQRFVLMLTGDPLNLAALGSSASPSLNQLLSILGEQAKAAAFVRLRDLQASIEDARSAEQLRDAIFSDALSNDLAALRKVVTELERLDAAFIGLCVGHVLEQHARAAGNMSASAGGGAAAESTVVTATTAVTAATQRRLRAEPTLVRSND